MKITNKIIGKRLVVWSLFSVILGFLFYVLGNNLIDKILSGIGIQFLLWGCIDALISTPALIGKKETKPKKLRKILIINGFLDILYILIGIIIIILWGNASFNVGNGVGVIIQGTFLLLFDFYHGINIDINA